MELFYQLYDLLAVAARRANHPYSRENAGDR